MPKSRQRKKQSKVSHRSGRLQANRSTKDLEKFRYFLIIKDLQHVVTRIEVEKYDVWRPTVEVVKEISSREFNAIMQRLEKDQK